MDREGLAKVDVEKLRNFITKYPLANLEITSTMWEGYVDVMEPCLWFETPLVRCSKHTAIEVEGIMREVLGGRVE